MWNNHLDDADVNTWIPWFHFPKNQRQYKFILTTFQRNKVCILKQGGQRRPLKVGDTSGRGQWVENISARENQASWHHFSKSDFLLKPDFTVSQIIRVVLQLQLWQRLYVPMNAVGESLIFSNTIQLASKWNQRQAPGKTQHRRKITKSTEQDK